VPAQTVQAYGLVLAAGQGRRFGGGKLVASFHGRPLLSHVLEVVRAACERGILGGGYVVVQSDDARALALSADARLDPLFNDAPHRGLSHSVRLGLTALEGRADAGAALVFLGDQPLVRIEVVEALISAWQKGAGAIVRPRYEDAPDVPGHPVLLDRSTWPLARQLQGDRGFNRLLTSTSVFTVDVPGANPDVDSQADLNALEESSP
jgi:molybdenum cofactor cytidylyltransferase